MMNRAANMPNGSAKSPEKVKPGNQNPPLAQLARLNVLATRNKPLTSNRPSCNSQVLIEKPFVPPS